MTFTPSPFPHRSPLAETRRFDSPLAPSCLDRMLQDPLIRLVMASDGVEETDIRRLAERVARRAGPTVTPSPRLAQNCAGCA